MPASSNINGGNALNAIAGNSLFNTLQDLIVKLEVN